MSNEPQGTNSGLVRVRFLPSGREVLVPKGTTLARAARVAEVAIDAPCGNRGVCGKCRLLATQGVGEVTEAEERLLLPRELSEGWRLACQATVEADAVVTLRSEAMQMALTTSDLTIEVKPNVRKRLARVALSTLQAPRADLDQLREALEPEGDGVCFPLPALRQLARVLRAGEDRVTLALTDGRCLAVEAGDTTGECYGMAFDIGTTTIVGALVDLRSGAQIGVASALNTQASFGADVISRIGYTMTDPEGLEVLQERVVGVLNDLTQSVMEQSGVKRERIYEATVVGNTCMHHLFLGLDPRSLAVVPYNPVVVDPLTVYANELGLRLAPQALVHVLPNIGGFVGADIVAGVLATGVHRRGEVRIFIDIGTNGEIVIGSRERLVCCSTAAGPAFEGAQITFGMRAAEGAIEHVHIGPDTVKLKVIGHTRPRGICGSGLIDVVAELLRVGLLDQTGRLLKAEQAREVVGEKLASRLFESSDGLAFSLFGGPEPVYVTQRDIRKLQLAKGAINAGIAILSRRLGIDPERDVQEVVLAGAFGSYVDPASTRAIGLIPPLPLSRLIAAGNTAGMGAKMALVSTDARAEAARIARAIEYIELSNEPDFQDRFADAMYFPDPAAIAALE